MNRMSAIVLALATFGLAACGAETAPPATGASSSAPNAVDQAYHGAVGGANQNTPVDAGNGVKPQ